MHEHIFLFLGLSRFFPSIRCFPVTDIYPLPVQYTPYPWMVLVSQNFQSDCSLYSTLWDLCRCSCNLRIWRIFLLILRYDSFILSAAFGLVVFTFLGMFSNALLQMFQNSGSPEEGYARLHCSSWSLLQVNVTESAPFLSPCPCSSSQKLRE